MVNKDNETSFYDVSNFELDNIPSGLLSSIGEIALSSYYDKLEQSNQQNFYDQVDILQAFGDGLLCSSVYDTKAIDFLTKNLDIEERKNVISNYFNKSEMNQENQDLVWSMLGDLRFSEQKFEQYYQEKESFYNMKNGEIDWSKIICSMDLDHIEETVSNINLESVIVSASTILDSLNKGIDDEGQLFKTVFEAKAFYAPICEIIGLDGFAMALRDKTLKIIINKNIEKLEAQIVNENDEKEKEILQNRLVEHYDALRRAKNLYERAGKTNICQVFESLGFEQMSGYLTAQVAGKRIDETDIVRIGDFATELSDGSLVSGVYRYKTENSLANKMLEERYRHQPPMDAIGLTFIINQDNPAAAFKKFFDQINGRTQIVFKPAATKNSAIYFHGSTDWVYSLDDYFKSQDIKPHIKEAAKDKFQVAKITFDLYVDGEPVGVEAQFISEKDRLDARIGESAHFIYKLDKELSESEKIRYVKFMKEIYNRKPFLNSKNDVPTIKSESYNRIDQIKKHYGFLIA